MKRNWEIIRAILIRLEGVNTPNAAVNMNSFDEFDAQEVAYNMRLLHQAECIDARISESHTGDGLIASAYVKSLTSKGHDLLDSIKNDSVWAKIKESFSVKGVDMTVDLVVMVGKKIVESMFN